MGRPIYAITNWITSDTIDCVSSEDSSGFYNVENIANMRPSKPWRSEHGSGEAASGALHDEWICVDLGKERKVTFVGVFNHNLTRDASEFYAIGSGTPCGLQSGSEVCPGVFCSGSDCFIKDLTPNITETHCRFPNTCGRFSNKDRYWLFCLSDVNVEESYIEIGELFLGQWQEFGSKVRLQPGRADGPLYFRGDQMTHYGQMWPAYYSQAEHFGITFKNINDADVVDELHCFLDDVMTQTGGRFVWVPDRDKPFCYYVKVMNSEDFAQRLMYGENRELREWTMELRTLTRGISLL